MLYVDNGSGRIGSRMDAVAALEAAGLTATARTIKGEPDEAVQQIVATEGFDPLVMGAYGHSRIRSLIIGSTTTAMVQAVNIPDLLYRRRPILNRPPRLQDHAQGPERRRSARCKIGSHPRGDDPARHHHHRAP